jgi:hypothetical protein
MVSYLCIQSLRGFSNRRFGDNVKCEGAETLPSAIGGYSGMMMVAGACVVVSLRK